ncbi:uncharacterized protein LOC106378448 [Brassica napus]|uniref:uncharacterized protein LOC106378448 n=1 Tax=Brassica napus TaxID=3708 RepID=UPI0006AB139C|nr:uncharacterized protein LOC106378448 [Brassica napus]
MPAPETPVVPVTDPLLSKDGPVKQGKASWVKGRFLAKAPHVARIHYIVNRIWPLGDKSIKIDVYEVNEVTVKFRIKDEATRKRVLRRGMWNIVNIPLVLSKWSPEDEEEEEEEITTIPMWIVMKNVPRRMFSWKGLGFVASAVGKPKRLYLDTLLCNSFEEAKVFVEADMTKELPTHHRFKSKLCVDAEVEFTYPWLPDRCTICSKWGHLHAACKSKVKILTKDKPQHVEKNGREITQERVLHNKEADTVQRNGKEVEVAVSTESMKDSEAAIGCADGEKKSDDLPTTGNMSSDIEIVHPEVEKSNGNISEGENSEWLNVSPTKTGRSGNKITAQNHNLSSPSRFAILSTAEDSVEEVDENEANTTGKETEEGEIIPESVGNETDEGKVESEVNSQEVRENNTMKEKVDVREERLLRSTIPRPTRGSTKAQSDTQSTSTKDTILSFNKKKKHAVVKKWVEDKGFQFGALFETRVTEGRSRRISTSVFNSWSMMSNYEDNSLGRIWFVWRSDVQVTPVFKSDQLITVSIVLEGDEKEFFLSVVYALNTETERHVLWEDLKNHQNSPIFRRKPWLVMGDFNETLDIAEHYLYETSPVATHGMREFQSVTQNCSLLDFPSHGPVYMWSNKRSEGIISKKLDRVLFNDYRLNSFPGSFNVFEEGGCSDHLRCRIHLSSEQNRPKRPFKFVNAVASLEGFLPMMAQYWTASVPIYS